MIQILYSYILIMRVILRDSFLLCPLFENLDDKFMGITGIVYIRVIREQRVMSTTLGKVFSIEILYL